MNREYAIRHNIEKLGVTVELEDGEWTSVPFKAIINPLWRKRSSGFEKSYTPLGDSISDYFLYIGSANHNITELSDDAVLLYNDRRYEFKHRDEIAVNDEILYYEGILRLLRGDDENEA